MKIFIKSFFGYKIFFLRKEFLAHASLCSPKNPTPLDMPIKNPNELLPKPRLESHYDQNLMSIL